MRHVGSDPQAERGRGEVNLSPILGLTLRPRVGGFYVSGRLWEGQSIVLYVFGRLWEAHSVVFYVSGEALGGSRFPGLYSPGESAKESTLRFFYARGSELSLSWI